MQDQATLMTQGASWKHILKFSLPIMLGQLFQTLYNVVDSLVVGNYLDENALAAVVSSGNLINLLVSFFTGLFTGASVMIARYFGARENEKLQKGVHTAVAFGLTAGIIMSLVGVFLTPTLLHWMSTPETVYPHAVLYFRIYFSGAVFTVLYSTAAGILQAVGDAKHPLRLLILSSILNVILDLLFVGLLHMGVDGAALATVISQMFSAVLALLQLIRVDASYKLTVRKIRFHKEMLLQILKLGIPSGFQNSIIAIANVVVQSSINIFGEYAVAGSGIYNKLSGFAFLPITSFSLALSTFVGQNLGAGNPKRARQGARFGIIAGLLLAECFGLTIYLLAPQLLSVFTRNEEVLRYGVMHARTLTPFYFLLAFSHLIAGIMRGAGRAIVPMIVMAVCWCGIRVSYILLFVRPSGNIQYLYWAYPMTWALSSAAFLGYYLLADWTGEKRKQAV